MAKYSDDRPETERTIPAHDLGIVLRHSGSDLDGYGIRQALVFAHEDRYIMHYDGADDTVGWSSYRAVSDDLVHWKKEGRILCPSREGEFNWKYDRSGSTYLYPFFENGVWHGFYIGSNCALSKPSEIPSFPYITLKARADSPFGPWIKEDILPFYMKKGTYYETTASSGAVVRDGNEYLQFFSASVDRPGVGTRRTLGIARTRDLHGVWSVDPEPLFPLSEQVENSALYFQQETGTWFLFTNHVGIGNSGEYTDAVWVYWSDCLQRWNARDKALVFDGSMCGWSKKVIGAPSVIRRDGTLYLFYDGAEGERCSHYHRHIGAAALPLPIIV